MDQGVPRLSTGNEGGSFMHHGWLICWSSRCNSASCATRPWWCPNTWAVSSILGAGFLGTGCNALHRWFPRGESPQSASLPWVFQLLCVCLTAWRSAARHSSFVLSRQDDSMIRCCELAWYFCQCAHRRKPYSFWWPDEVMSQWITSCNVHTLTAGFGLNHVHWIELVLLMVKYWRNLPKKCLS